MVRPGMRESKTATNIVSRRVSRRILSISTKCPTSIILSASSSTRNRRHFNCLAKSSLYMWQLSMNSQTKDIDIRPTSCIMSQSLPGVATSTSTPLSRMRFCFCADIPPTIAATLTWGGFFSIGFPASICNAPPMSVIAGSFEDSMDVRRELRWEDTWSANSRVGARTKARRERFLDEDGRGWESKWCRIGKPYASVFPDPYTTFNHQRKINYSKVFFYRLSNSYDVPTSKCKGQSRRLNGCRRDKLFRV